jgi:hypothetical protein
MKAKNSVLCLSAVESRTGFWVSSSDWSLRLRPRARRGIIPVKQIINIQTLVTNEVSIAHQC